MKSKSQIKRVAVQSPDKLAKECLKLIQVNCRLRDALAAGLDFVEQLKNQGVTFLPAEMDIFEEAALEAIAFAGAQDDG